MLRFDGRAGSNCFLCGVDARDILTEQDLEPSDGYTIYGQTDSRECRAEASLGDGDNTDTGNKLPPGQKSGLAFLWHEGVLKKS